MGQNYGNRQQYDNNMRGKLFRNEKKTEAKHADYNGDCEIDGVEYWMSAWVKEVTKGARAGQKLMSFSFKQKENNGGGNNGQQNNNQQNNGNNQNKGGFGAGVYNQQSGNNQQSNGQQGGNQQGNRQQNRQQGNGDLPF